ncbi:YlaF family protein [Sutcliffiella horikoshii]|uniref:YlaF family protein n=1 Tax=Sutcliffiella horikoshii TaxID=79883 RepID=UPI00384F98AE
MKGIKWIFMLYAVLAAISLGMVGIAIGERNTLGIVGAFVLFGVVMGLGFKTKRKMRENGQL